MKKQKQQVKSTTDPEAAKGKSKKHRGPKKQKAKSKSNKQKAKSRKQKAKLKSKKHRGPAAAEAAGKLDSAKEPRAQPREFLGWGACAQTPQPPIMAMMPGLIWIQILHSISNSGFMSGSGSRSGHRQKKHAWRDWCIMNVHERVQVQCNRIRVLDAQVGPKWAVLRSTSLFWDVEHIEPGICSNRKFVQFPIKSDIILNSTRNCMYELERMPNATQMPPGVSFGRVLIRFRGFWRLLFPKYIDT